MAGFTAGQAHLQNLLNASNQNGGTFRDDMLLAQDPAGFQQADPAQADFQQGNAFQQVNPKISPMGLLKKYAGLLFQGGKDFINAPIIGPTITKDQHEKYLETGDRGVQNWHPH